MAEIAMNRDDHSEEGILKAEGMACYTCQRKVIVHGPVSEITECENRQIPWRRPLSNFAYGHHFNRRHQLIWLEVYYRPEQEQEMKDKMTQQLLLFLAVGELRNQ